MRSALVLLCLALLCVAPSGCGVTGPTEYPNALTNSDGEPIYFDDISDILSDTDLSDDEMKEALRDLGIEDEDLIDALVDS